MSVWNIYEHNGLVGLIHRLKLLFYKCVKWMEHINMQGLKCGIRCNGPARQRIKYGKVVLFPVCEFRNKHIRFRKTICYRFCILCRLVGGKKYFNGKFRQAGSMPFCYCFLYLLYEVGGVCNFSRWHIRKGIS